MKVFIIAVIIMALVEVLFVMYSEPSEPTTDPVYLEEDYKHDHIVLWDLISRIPVTELCDILKHCKGLRQMVIKSSIVKNNKKLFTTDIDEVICFACHYIDNCCKGNCDECPVKWADGSNKVICLEDNSTYILWIEQVAYLSDLFVKCDYDCTDLEVLTTYERMCELARTIRDSWRD